MTNKLQKKKRVIERLRKKFPGKWGFNRATNQWYHCDDGYCVYMAAMFSPRFDGDDDSFDTVFYRTDTRERVFI